MKCSSRISWLVLAVAVGWSGPGIAQELPAAASTSTEWRNDAASLEVTAKLNEAYARLPFSVEHEEVLDDPPLSITWTVGPNLPTAWKGGVGGLIGRELVLAGGLWMPSRENLAYAFGLDDAAYRKIDPPPVNPAYTQGACDGQRLYQVGGRSAGRSVFQLSRAAGGKWQWTAMPSLPESEGEGRWLAACGVVPGKWLFLVGGHPTGTPSEVQGRPRMADLRLRLDPPDAPWEAMAPYPPGKRNLCIPAVAQDKLYIFGGSEADAPMRAIQVELARKYRINVPYNGVPNYRDAWRYDPQTDRWQRIHPLPVPMVAGAGVVLKNRYILLMGSADVRAFRVGKTMGSNDPHWLGYGDLILCYDIEADNYSRIGVMPYGVATTPWLTNGQHLWAFGGEPAHGYNMNTENVLQIGTIHWR